jgi:hypothetical protein
MTKITLAQVQALADLQVAGKSPWITIADDTVQGVYTNRDGARGAKNGKPVKYDPATVATELTDSPADLPSGDAVATAMGLPAELEGEQAEEGVSTFVTQGNPDAAEFAAFKADEAAPEVTATVTPINPAAEAPKVAKVKADIRHASEPLRPTKLVWQIADDMLAANPATTRKDVLAECERRGIAFFTARTQYQVWKTMQANAAAEAAKVVGK